MNLLPVFNFRVSTDDYWSAKTQAICKAQIGHRVSAIARSREPASHRTHV
jgi:hypothetical protein